MVDVPITSLSPPFFCITLEELSNKCVSVCLHSLLGRRRQEGFSRPTRGMNIRPCYKTTKIQLQADQNTVQSLWVKLAWNS